MNPKNLNFIIISSLVGILIIVAKDYYYSKKNFSKKEIFFLSPTPTIKVKSNYDLDLPVTCQHKYFNFKKGNFWRYKLTLETEFNQRKQKKELFLTNKIVYASNSSVIIETEFERKKEKTTLICKKTGIYGFPFSLPTNLLPESFPFNSFNQLLNPNQQKIFLFLPAEEKLETERAWENSLLPPLSLENRVLKKRKQSVLNLGIIDILTIESKLKLDQFFPNSILPKQLFNYHLGENIGILGFDSNLKLEEFGKINLSLSLVEFKNIK